MAKNETERLLRKAEKAGARVGYFLDDVVVGHYRPDGSCAPGKRGKGHSLRAALDDYWRNVALRGGQNK